MILQPIPWQELCHQPAKACVSARSYGEIRLWDFDMLPRFLLGWVQMATQYRATAAKETECWPQCFKAAALLPYALACSLTIPEECEVVRSLRWRGE